MKEFKSRLKILMKAALVMGTILTPVFGFILLMEYVKWFSYTVGIGCLILIAGTFIWLIWVFIKWLFIEPFRRGQSDDGL